jgi:phosphatidylethanolamine/phosphatidyl-N-methylethanolamine N-methyltransferase
VRHGRPVGALGECLDEAASMLLFARRWLKDPMKVGAVAPSSTVLARAMVKALDLEPGTGAFTEHLVEACHGEVRVVLVEQDQAFVGHLRRRFRNAEVIAGDARDLPQLLAANGIGQVPRILSGLPLRSIPPPLRMRLARAMGDALEQGGRMVQFTYLAGPPLLPRLAAAARVEGRRVDFVARNAPPAFIWVYGKVAEPVASTGFLRRSHA